MATSRLAPVVIVVSVLLISPSAFGGPDGSVSPPAVPSLLSSAADDVFSVADLSTLLDPNGTQHYGPYPSSSPDSSTCGNAWATDTFNRVFTVRTNPDGTFLVVEQFKAGRTVRVYQSARDPQVPDTRFATARLEVTVSNADRIVGQGAGVWPQVRRGLSYSASVLLTSLTWVVFGLCVVLPWAVVGYGGYRLVRRATRGGTAAATPPQPLP